MRITVIQMIGVVLLAAGQAAAQEPPPPPPGKQQPQDQDDGPGRGVARISLINGDVSVKRGDTGDLTAAAINAPLVVEDRVVTGDGSRAEVQFDWANMIRVAPNGEIRMAELENRRYVVQLARGMATFRVLRDSDADLEISTPSIAVRPVKRGTYRIVVREDGSTEVTVRSGEAEIYTPRGTQRLRSGKTMMARGSVSDPEFQMVNSIPDDEWDRWNTVRDRQLERSTAYKYVSRDVYGADDLDAHGRWVYSPPYGWVWSPYTVAGWAPYRHGRWVWVDWYGWTWVSYDPWGWAPYHYGRWYYSSPYGWCWWPGAIGPRHYWRPALVAFVGWNSYSGVNVGLGFGGGFGRVGWIPLAPYEVYRPWYGSRYYAGYRNGGYYNNSVNVVNNVNITNVYRNSRVNNGVTVIDGGDFRNGRVVNYRSVGTAELHQANVVHGQLPIAPGRESLRMADRDVGRAAFAGSSNDRFYSRTRPASVDRVPFEQQRQGLEQYSRRSFSDTRGADTTHGGANVNRVADAPARVSNRDAGHNDSGWRRFGEPTRSGDGGGVRSTETQRGSGTQNGGWRRAGEGARGEGGAGVRPAESHAQGGTSNGGWRRFGEPASAGNAGESPRMRSSGDGSRGGAETRNADSSNGGWRRFNGNSTERMGGSPRSDVNRSQAPQGDSGRGGWQRMSDAPRQVEGGSRTEGGRGRSVDNGGSRPDSGSGRRFESSGRSGGGEAVRISPPMVRERSGGGGGGSTGAAPRSSGGPSGGGGGGRSSGGGGGNGGGGGGGGRSGGGGGHGRGR